MKLVFASLITLKFNLAVGHRKKDGTHISWKMIDDLRSTSSVLFATFCYRARKTCSFYTKTTLITEWTLWPKRRLCEINIVTPYIMARSSGTFASLIACCSSLSITLNEHTWTKIMFKCSCFSTETWTFLRRLLIVRITRLVPAYTTKVLIILPTLWTFS